MVFLLTCRNCGPWIFLMYLSVAISVLFHSLARSSRWGSRNSIPKWELVSYHDRGLTAADTKGAEEAEGQQQWEPYYLVALRQNQPWPLPSVKGGWAAVVCARPHDIFIGEAIVLATVGHCPQGCGTSWAAQGADVGSEVAIMECLLGDCSNVWDLL